MAVQKTSENGIVKPDGFESVQGNFNVTGDVVNVTVHLPLSIRLNRKDGTFVEDSDTSPFAPELINALKADAQTIDSQF